MYSTGNYIQYPVINHNGKEYKKRMCVCMYIYICVYTHIYVTESLCCTAEINQLYFILKNSFWWLFVTVATEQSIFCY